MHLQILYFEGCPNWQLAARRLRAVARARGLEVTERRVHDEQDAAACGFRGSPTILIDDADPFGGTDAPDGLACRVYRTPDGLAGAPTTDQLEAALDEASRGPSR